MLSTRSVICTCKERTLKNYAVRAGSIVQQKLSEGSHYGKRISGFRAAGAFPVYPEMFTETEFAANEEKNKMTTKESEGDNHVNNSGTSQYTNRGTI
jgi:hypothetical protein